ncbi:MAG TPA: methanogenesis marker 9 domain-containing protein [Methanocorpusculum sp.]|nr:methanogenesis marker 9 domain-containing protein [Methanocorpusculum sp.]
MAGITDAAYVTSRSAHVGGAFIGGYSIDEPTIAASKEVEACGRKEFTATLDDIVAELESLKGTGLALGANLRGTTPETYFSAAQRLGKDCIIEIDAHCRQKPMIQAGAGEALLADVPRLCSIVSVLHEAGFCVSVKFRAGIADDRELAKALWKAGADILHVDLMDFGHAKLRQIRNACPLIIIGNNGVVSPEVMMDYFSHGADLVSLARSAEPELLAELSAYSAEMAETIGWYNAPKQVCRGGDYRGLAFCCMPIKQCPLLPTLSAIGMEYQAYVDLKTQAVAGTMLESGNSACFGSLAYCCKSSTPCMFRDMSLMEAGLSKPEYMRLKRNLSETIMQNIFAGDRKQ